MDKVSNSKADWIFSYTPSQLIVIYDDSEDSSKGTSLPCRVSRTCRER